MITTAALCGAALLSQWALGAIGVTHIAMSVRHARAVQALGVETGMAAGTWLVADLHMHLTMQPQVTYDWSTGQWRPSGAAPVPTWQARLVAQRPRAWMCIGTCGPAPLWPAGDAARRVRHPRRRGMSVAASGPAVRVRLRPMGELQVGLDVSGAPPRASLARPAIDDPWRRRGAARRGDRYRTWSAAAAIGWRRTMPRAQISAWSVVRLQRPTGAAGSVQHTASPWRSEAGVRVDGASAGALVQAGRCAAGLCAAARVCARQGPMRQGAGCVRAAIRGPTRLLAGRLEGPIGAGRRGVVGWRLSMGRGPPSVAASVRFVDRTRGLQLSLAGRLWGRQAPLLTPSVAVTRTGFMASVAVAVPCRAARAVRCHGALRVWLGARRQHGVGVHAEASRRHHTVSIRYVLHLAPPAPPR